MQGMSAYLIKRGRVLHCSEEHPCKLLHARFFFSQFVFYHCQVSTVIILIFHPALLKPAVHKAVLESS